MSLHSVDLHHIHYHEVVDEWKILFVDNELNPFNEDKLLSLKSKLEQDIRNISFAEEGVAYSKDFTLPVKDEYLIGKQYSFPDGDTFQELIEKTINTILSFAQKEEINALLEIHLNGIEYGNSFHHYFHATSLFGQTSSADVKVYEDDDEERLYWDIDYEDDTDNEYILEALSDNLSDNSDETPFDCNEDGRLSEDGERLSPHFTRHPRMHLLYSNRA
ncbi:MAG: hypothetical protein IJ268_06510 [Proteobacteria bacterium]|nr:hypothetical protein [Pseudomonadota bacterium]